MGPGGAQKPFGVNPANYKRDMCKYYESGRQCPYQARCSFAHGNSDIRMQSPMNFGGKNMGQGPNPNFQQQKHQGQMTPQMGNQMMGMPGQMPPTMYPNNMFQQDWQMPQMQGSQLGQG